MRVFAAAIAAEADTFAAAPTGMGTFEGQGIRCRRPCLDGRPRPADHRGRC
jgi:microcystin degradation protein MlrC